MTKGGKCNWIYLIFFPLCLMSGCRPSVVSPPYTHSDIIDTIVFDWSKHIRLAPGSDNWPITWADDGHQYASWGDGGGFGGTNSDGRVSLGVARIEGDAGSYTAFNVLGGKESENPGQYDGKSYGIISINGILYQWVSPGSGAEGYKESRLYFSRDHGSSWESVDWAFVSSDGIVNPTFCQFGRDYSGARDEFVYIYANHIKDRVALDVQIPGEIALMRVSQNNVLNRSEYEYFIGLANNGDPLWSSRYSEHQPVFADNNGVGWNTSVSYNKGLGRYILVTEHTKSMNANIGIFDAAEPWGPWTTVYYGKFGKAGVIPQTTFFYNFSNKWLSDDGQEFVLVFTGIHANDSWNTVAGNFTLMHKTVEPDMAN